ncbi:MAG: glucose-1-phosphate adenylyltransferase [Chloroflexi bacterium]|nr:glucose-1-phosphate adenylyltransferase [Anaerolineaceae bacterium]NMB88689.1 glucose-1-phosphate adenylyltransferase [Chloroflexota bacterium]
MPALNDVLAVILGGGRGSRLYPLTQQRSKPAVPIAGKYRLIDIPISNCINSGIYRIAVLTQFNSVSLHRHIADTYVFDTFHTGWVQIWAAEQTVENTDWYQGTADAVRKQLFEIHSTRASHVLVLAGDHLYRMDYAAMAHFHWEHDADITVAVQPALREDAGRFGILKREAGGRITSFAEKPKDAETLADMVSRDDPAKPYLASMGIYLFKTQVLFDLLRNYAFEDFGGQVIPHAIHNNAVYGYDFEGYWEDIGTIRSFYDTNLALSMPDSPFNFYDPERPIYTHSRFLPGSIVEGCTLENVLLAEGCFIQDAEIHHSIVGLRSQIRKGVKMRDTIMMGSDYYERPMCQDCDDDIPLGIGGNSYIEGAIIDKNAHVGHDVIIRPFPRDVDLDGANWVVRDGIVVVPKNAVIAPGTVITPESARLSANS